jgi:hypothetical protein
VGGAEGARAQLGDERRPLQLGLLLRLKHLVPTAEQ